MGRQFSLYDRVPVGNAGDEGVYRNRRIGCQLGKQAATQGAFLKQGGGEIGMMGQAVPLFWS
jgi:hypothetical protein